MSKSIALPLLQICQNYIPIGRSHRKEGQTSKRFSRLSLGHKGMLIEVILFRNIPIHHCKILILAGHTFMRQIYAILFIPVTGYVLQCYV